MIPTIIITAITCLVMIVCVITNAEIKKLHIPLYWIVTLVGAFIILITGLLPWDIAFSSLVTDTSVNPVKILILFLSMTMLSVFLDEAGFFKYLAVITLKKAGNSQKKLFIMLFITVSVLTVFTSNDIIILTFTPFICYFCKQAKINPLPFLIEEFVCANTFSMALMIGNPTNVYLALFKNISFMEYLSVMWLPAIVGGIVAFVVMFALFYRQLKQPIYPSLERVTLNKPLVIIGLVHLVLCTILLAFADALRLEMWIISAISALSLFVVVTVYQLVHRDNFAEEISAIRRAPWGLVPFMLSMFIIVSALDYNGATAKFAELLSFANPTFSYGIASTLACNVVNNIPMSVLFGSLINVSNGSLGAVYACVIGSNIGAFLTPIGALAGIMWSNILKGHNVKIGYLKFVFYGFIIAVPTLLSSLFSLWLII